MLHRVVAIETFAAAITTALTVIPVPPGPNCVVDIYDDTTVRPEVIFLELGTGTTDLVTWSADHRSPRDDRFEIRCHIETRALGQKAREARRRCAALAGAVELVLSDLQTLSTQITASPENPALGVPGERHWQVIGVNLRNPIGPDTFPTADQGVGSKITFEAEIVMRLGRC
jgi:hypothetical protein